MNSALIYALMGVHGVSVAAETYEWYGHVENPEITAVTGLQMPTMPHGHESTQGSTGVVEAWNLTQATSSPMISTEPLWWPSGMGSSS